LTRSEAERIVASAIYRDYTLKAEDLPLILEAKRPCWGDGLPESVAADFSMEDVGGLENLKGWLRLRRDGFSKKARDYGLPDATRDSDAGIPGAGKSLCAKAVRRTGKCHCCDWIRASFTRNTLRKRKPVAPGSGTSEAMAPVVPVD